VSVDDGVGHDHVEAPRPRLHVLEQRVHRRGAPRVRPNARGLLPDRRDDFVESPLIASRHDDGGALFRELRSDGEADSLRAASDNSHPSIECMTHIVSFPVLLCGLLLRRRTDDDLVHVHKHTIVPRQPNGSSAPTPVVVSINISEIAFS
jgi:hypothetical protein